MWTTRDNDETIVIPFKPRHCAAPQQRANSAFQGRQLSFEWTDEQWSRLHLPWIRFAAAALAKDQSELETAICKLSFFDGTDRSLSIMLERWRETKQHLEELCAIIDAALNRSSAVLERIGYDPNKPPPGSA
jgi:hypothetical protein